MSTFIDFHALHPVAPSNLNRDENGSPKTTIVGGVRRHRVSSQSWKKAIRDYFNAGHITSNPGYRTKNVTDLLVAEILAQDPEFSPEDAKKAAVSTLVACGLIGKKRAEKDETTTDALVLVSKNQLAFMATQILAGASEKDINAALKENQSIDLALFGRMVASNTALNVEASSQFAHAFSTHASDPEFDFFTAVDDYSTVDHAGAGMMGDTEFVSSTLYRYATVNLDHLAENLVATPEVIADAIEAFTEAFIKTTPSGKQNSFATPTLPTAVLVSVRTGAPLSYSAAFEKPVKAYEDGYDAPSVEALVRYVEGVNRMYADASPRYAVALTGEAEEKLGRIAGIRDLAGLHGELRNHILALSF